MLTGAETVALKPRAYQLPAMPGHLPLDELPDLQNFTFKGDWLDGDDFQDAYLSHRTRLQVWTMRYQRGASRFSPI